MVSKIISELTKNEKVIIKKLGEKYLEEPRRHHGVVELNFDLSSIEETLISLRSEGLLHFDDYGGGLIKNIQLTVNGIQIALEILKFPLDEKVILLLEALSDPSKSYERPHITKLIEGEILLKNEILPVIDFLNKIGLVEWTKALGSLGYVEITDPGRKLVRDLRKVDPPVGISRIFISYGGTEGKIYADLLEEALEKTGWIEPVVVKGNRFPPEKFEKKVTSALDNSCIVIAIITKDSINRQWPNQEIGYAYGLNKNAIYQMRDIDVEENLKGFLIKNEEAVQFGNDKKEFKDAIKDMINILEKHKETVLKFRKLLDYRLE